MIFHLLILSIMLALINYLVAKVYFLWHRLKSKFKVLFSDSKTFGDLMKDGTEVEALLKDAKAVQAYIQNNKHFKPMVDVEDRLADIVVKELDLNSVRLLKYYAITRKRPIVVHLRRSGMMFRLQFRINGNDFTLWKGAVLSFPIIHEVLAVDERITLHKKKQIYKTISDAPN